MRILMAIDRSEAAARARDLVASLRLGPAVHVRLLSVVSEMATAYGGDVEAHVAAFLEEAAAPLRGSEASVETQVLLGEPAKVILAEGAAADLLVIGNDGRAAMADFVLGSTSAQIVDQSSVPILVARHAHVTRLLIAEDGSGAADRAATFVAESGLFAGLPAGVVSVAAAGDGRDDLQERRLAHEAIGQRRAEALRAGGFRELTVHAPDGDPADEIVARAKALGADLIVLGASGRGGLRGRFLGSVARNIMHSARCSILTARPDMPPAT